VRQDPDGHAPGQARREIRRPSTIFGRPHTGGGRNAKATAEADPLDWDGNRSNDFGEFAVWLERGAPRSIAV